MTTFNFPNLASTFKHLANYTASSGKTLVGVDSRDGVAQPSNRTIRDVFTLSEKGRLAYEKLSQQKADSKLQMQAKCQSPPATTTNSLTAAPSLSSAIEQQQTHQTAQIQVAKVTQAPRIFSTTPGSVDNLIQFLGLDTINANEATLTGALNLSLEAEGKELTARLNDLLQQVGLDNEQNEIILSEDAEGNIIVEGNIDSEKKKQLEELINNDPELVEQIKGYRAKLEIAHGIENGMDITADEFAAARQQLMKSFLQREGGFSLDDVAIKSDPVTGAKSLFQKDSDGNEVKDSILPSLLSKMPGLGTELFQILETLQKTPEQSGDGNRPLLAINQGELSTAGSEIKIEAKIVAVEGGLENYEKAEFKQLSELSPEQTQHIRDFIAKIRPRQNQQRDYNQNSEHLDKIASALGLDPTRRLQPGTKDFYAHARDNVRILHAQSQVSREKIDEKVSDILKAKNIVLDKNETLNFKVNQRGEISVGDGMSEDKRAKVEKILNEDSSLGKDLLFVHAQRKIATGQGALTGVSAHSILIDSILQQEYGISLHDFQISKTRMNMTPSDADWKRSHQIVTKGGISDMAFYGEHELLDKLYNEDLRFYDEIVHALNYREEHGEDFEVDFSYKNGVTIEKGATDQAALNEVAMMFLPMDLLHFGAQSSVTLDSSGKVRSTQIVDGGFLGIAEATSRLKGFFGRTEQNDFLVFSAVSPTQSRLQQYTFDAQRLFQFNTGVDTATAKAMNVTFNTGGTT